MSKTDLNVVERVELHEIMQSLEGLVGVFKVEGRVRRSCIIKYVKISKFDFLVCFSGNSCKVIDMKYIMI